MLCDRRKINRDQKIINCFKLQRNSQSPFNAKNQIDKIRKLEYHLQLKNCGTFWVKKFFFFAVHLWKNNKGWAKF